MTIDERLQAIAERLDTFTTLHIELDQQTSARLAELAERGAESDRRLNQLAHIVQIEHETVKALERIATAHEQRLDDIEGQ